MDPVWLPLQGPGGERPKAPRVGGWQSPSYKGVDPYTYDDTHWIGLRCDGLVVVDCDSDESAAWWRKHVGPSGTEDAWIRKTPRGWHFIYRWVPGSPEGPDADVFRGDPPGIDVRAGRGSQIVFYAPGYRTVQESKLSREYELS